MNEALASWYMDRPTGRGDETVEWYLTVYRDEKSGHVMFHVQEEGSEGFLVRGKVQNNTLYPEWGGGRSAHFEEAISRAHACYAAALAAGFGEEQ